MLNKNHDKTTLSELFSFDKRIAVEKFFDTEVAERIHNACKTSIPFSTHYVLDEKYQSKTKHEIVSMGKKEAQETFKKISEAAAKGVGFLYEGYLQSRANRTPLDIEDTELNFAHEVFEYFSSSEVVKLIKEITGDNSIVGAEPQFTRYTKGHFLTRHLDIVPNGKRKYAFVLGLTKNWHPDWGGLLQFYEQNGTPRDAWSPKFNVLSLFEVSHVHAVTYVTPFAVEPRLSLTGWFVSN